MNHDTGNDLHVSTPEEAAAILKCDAAWLLEQAQERKIPHAVLSGSCNFTSGHLAAIVTMYEVLPDDRGRPRSRTTVASAEARPELAHGAEDAAAIIGGTCKASWLKHEARDHRIPCTLIGGAYNFTDAQIREILAICEVRPQAKDTSTAAAPRPKTPAQRTPANREQPVLRARPPRARRGRQES